MSNGRPAVSTALPLDSQDIGTPVRNSRSNVTAIFSACERVRNVGTRADFGPFRRSPQCINLAAIEGGPDSVRSSGSRSSAANLCWSLARFGIDGNQPTRQSMHKLSRIELMNVRTLQYPRGRGRSGGRPDSRGDSGLRRQKLPLEHSARPALTPPVTSCSPSLVAIPQVEYRAISCKTRRIRPTLVKTLLSRRDDGVPSSTLR
jgi:hypothetical protein